MDNQQPPSHSGGFDELISAVRLGARVGASARQGFAGVVECHLASGVPVYAIIVTNEELKDSIVGLISAHMGEGPSKPPEVKP